MNLLISFIPIIVMIVMIVGFKVRGDITGTVGWILTIAVAVFFFNTDFVFSLLASLKGLLASMAITGMGFFALLQITFMQETGALQRVVVWIKTFSHGDQALPDHGHQRHPRLDARLRGCDPRNHLAADHVRLGLHDRHRRCTALHRLRFALHVCHVGRDRRHAYGHPDWRRLHDDRRVRLRRCKSSRSTSPITCLSSRRASASPCSSWQVVPSCSSKVGCLR